MAWIYLKFPIEIKNFIKHKNLFRHLNYLCIRMELMDRIQGQVINNALRHTPKGRINNNRQVAPSFIK